MCSDVCGLRKPRRGSGIGIGVYLGILDFLPRPGPNLLSETECLLLLMRQEIRNLSAVAGKGMNQDQDWGWGEVLAANRIPFDCIHGGGESLEE